MIEIQIINDVRVTNTITRKIFLTGYKISIVDHYGTYITLFDAQLLNTNQNI